jgi:hypothetical protein
MRVAARYCGLHRHRSEAPSATSCDSQQSRSNAVIDAVRSSSQTIRSLSLSGSLWSSAATHQGPSAPGHHASPGRSQWCEAGLMPRGPGSQRQHPLERHVQLHSASPSLARTGEVGLVEGRVPRPCTVPCEPTITMTVPTVTAMTRRPLGTGSREGQEGTGRSSTAPTDTAPPHQRLPRLLRALRAFSHENVEASAPKQPDTGCGVSSSF